jgi:hypothetical protein
MQTDNSTARSRAIDMRFYWVRDRVKQGHFDIYWAPGSTNLADYFTKHHPAKHHQAMRPIYLLPHEETVAEATAALAQALQVLQGCVETPQCGTDSEVKPARRAASGPAPTAPAEPSVYPTGTKNDPCPFKRTNPHDMGVPGRQQNYDEK